MKVPDCPKNLRSCNNYCPEYPCWALNKHLDQLDKEKKDDNKGWE